MKVTLNTNLFPIISVGMYNSNISPDDIFDDYSIIDDKENGYIHYDVDYFWSNFQNGRYVKRIEQLAGEYLNGTIQSESGIEVTIKCKEIYSPKEYNFGTDEIVMDVTYSKTKILQLIKKDNETFNQFLKDKYSSYDGFMSFTSNNFDDWIVDFEDNDVRAVGAVLRFLFIDWINEDHDEFDVYVRSELTCYSEFIDCDEYEAEVVILKTYVKDNYNTIDVDTLDFDQFEFEVLDSDSCNSIVKEVIHDIESNTLSLF